LNEMRARRRGRGVSGLAGDGHVSVCSTGKCEESLRLILPGLRPPRKSQK
jgi:hypothetical protein